MKLLDNKTIAEIVVMELREEEEPIDQLLSDYMIYIQEATSLRMAEMVVEFCRIKDHQSLKC